MTYPVFMVPAGDVLPIFFDTFAGATGASITMTGLAVTDIEIYKDGGVTQRASDAGYTLLDTDGIDFDGLTGIHGFSIDTGDNTDAGFYTVGAWFTVVVSAVTIDTQTVSFVAAQFRLMAAESVAAKPKVDVDAWLGTAAATPTVAGVPEVDVTHVAGATTNVAALATNVDAILADTADMQPKLGTPAGASISADILTIDNLVDGLESTIGAAGAGLTAVPWNAAWDAEVQSEAEDAIVVHRLDELLAADSDIDGAAPPTVGSVFHELMSKTSGSFTFDQATDSNEALRDNLATAAALATAQTSIDDVPTNAELATSQAAADDATLAAIAALNNLDAAGVRTAVGLAAANLDTQLTAIDDYLDTEVAAIKAKTDLIPAAPAAVGDIPTAATIVAAVLAGVIEGTITLQQATRVILAASAGKLSGAATATVRIRDTGDSVDRVTATVDESGNRSAVTLNLT